MKGFEVFMSISTIMDKIFEANFRFYFKEHFTRKVQYLVFSNF